MSEAFGHGPMEPPQPESDAARRAGLPASLNTVQITSANVTAVVGELQPGDPSVWHPQSYDEWERQERVTALLSAWTEQAKDERQLRRSYAKWIFGLITLQVVAVFGLLLALGMGRFELDVSMLKVVLPSVLGEVFGLGFVVAKYLFSQPIRHSLDSLVDGAHGRPSSEPDARVSGPKGTSSRVPTE